MTDTAEKLDAAEAIDTTLVNTGDNSWRTERANRTTPKKVYESPLTFKPTVVGNPKNAVGQAKPCIHFFPANVLAEVNEVMRSGAEKYGLKNWRATHVSASTYYDSIFRHMVEWYELGQDADPDSGLSPLAHIVASAAILLDAKDRGVLIDDRTATESK